SYALPESHPYHPELPSFPTRRSSDLAHPNGVEVVGRHHAHLRVGRDGGLRVPFDPKRIIRPSREREQVGDPYRLDPGDGAQSLEDRKSTRLNSSHSQISYAVFCLKKQ